MITPEPTEFHKNWIAKHPDVDLRSTYDLCSGLTVKLYECHKFGGKTLTEDKEYIIEMAYDRFIQVRNDDGRVIQSLADNFVVKSFDNTFIEAYYWRDEFKRYKQHLLKKLADKI